MHIVGNTYKISLLHIVGNIKTDHYKISLAHFCLFANKNILHSSNFEIYCNADNDDHPYNVHSHQKIVFTFSEEMKRRREENIPFLILNADGGANTFQKHINCKIHFYNREMGKRRYILYEMGQKI